MPTNDGRFQDEAIYKDPNAVLDYSFDWESLGWLSAGETIDNTSNPPQISISPAGSLSAQAGPTVLNGIVTVWLSGGSAGTTYEVSCLITTSLGRTDQRTMEVTCQAR